MKIIQSIIIAFSMYSKIPMPRIEWNKGNMRFSMCFFPFVGVVTGALILGWFKLSSLIGIGNLLSAIIFFAIPIVVTGGIHMDGFLDTIDAISSYQTMERRLEILKDSNSGAFAIIYGIVYSLTAVGVYSEILLRGNDADIITGLTAIEIIAVSFVFSRALSGFSVTTFKCAKNSGLAATFSDMADKKKARVILGVEALAGAGLMVYINTIAGLVTVIVGLAFFGVYRVFSYRKFGGITGDLAGFFLQMCELLMAAAVLVVQCVLR